MSESVKVAPGGDFTTYTVTHHRHGVTIDGPVPADMLGALADVLGKRVFHERTGRGPAGCTAETCMNLPNGATCGDCVHIGRCSAMFGHRPTDTYCDWFPRRFRAATTENEQ